MVAIEKADTRAANTFDDGCGLSHKGGGIRPRDGLTRCIIVAVILQIIFANSQFINNFFKTASMNLDRWLICFGVSLPMIAIAAYVNRFDPPN